MTWFNEVPASNPSAQLSPSDYALKTQQLAEARQAYHDLMTGQQIQRLRHGDRDMNFDRTATGVNDLRGYITSLETALGLPLTTFQVRTPWRRVIL